MFSRIGPWCHDHRRIVLGLWIAALFLANGIASSVGEDYRQDFTLPGAESTEGFDILNESFEGQGAGQTGTIVFQADQGVADPVVQAAMTELFDEVAAQDGVSFVESPYGERPGLISEDGTIAYANVEFPEDVDFAGRRRRRASSSPTRPRQTSTDCGWSWAATSSPSSRSRPPRRSVSPSPS